MSLIYQESYTDTRGIQHKIDWVKIAGAGLYRQDNLYKDDKKIDLVMCRVLREGEKMSSLKNLFETKNGHILSKMLIKSCGHTTNIFDCNTKEKIGFYLPIEVFMEGTLNEL